MGRWRPPSPASSPYITPQGYKRLEEELELLWKKRAETTKALAAAAAEGDRSENAEYIYRKKELREIDRRVHYLQKRMPVLKVVREVGDTSRVFFGASITLEDDHGNEVSYRIVGADEIDYAKENISIDSPMAKSLLGKTLDEQIVIRQTGSKKSYTIVDIEYPC
ncbi:MAG: transcription elongation factor GreB [Gammaproteobacteria bacterium]|nr:transcription elongation factor GreB [Gammaproteobacteria bacterium]